MNLEKTIRKILEGEASACCMDDEDDVNRTVKALLRELKYLEESNKKMHFLSENACKSCWREYESWCEENDLL